MTPRIRSSLSLSFALSLLAACSSPSTMDDSSTRTDARDAVNDTTPTDGTVAQDSGVDAGEDAALDASDATIGSDGAVDSGTPDDVTSMDVANDHTTVDVVVPTDVRDVTPIDDLPIGACASNRDCRTGEYCAGTGCDTPGNCSPRADICPDNLMPVCGCDGHTYSNRCYASRAGVRVASNDSCP